jgi:hypothetical protein
VQTRVEVPGERHFRSAGASFRKQRHKPNVSPSFIFHKNVGGEYASRTAYTGYQSVALAQATIPVTLTGTPAGGTTPISIIYPETQTTWTVRSSGIGGYGSKFANNTGCSTELAPGGTSAPSAGANCAGDTRYIGEGTIGFWNKIYQGEKGRVQWGIQYSYFYKNTWSGNGGTLPTGIPQHFAARCR